MIHGLDSGFLVAAEVAEHAQHSAARQTLSRLHAAGDRIGIAPQVLAEFIHVVTDRRRFARPLSTQDACKTAEQWWLAREVDHVFPNAVATRQFLGWLEQFSLGRKRLLDTLLAATYAQAGIRSILTTNPPKTSHYSGCSTALRRPGPRSRRGRRPEFRPERGDSAAPYSPQGA